MGVCGWILFAQDSLSYLTNQSASWGKVFLQHPPASPRSALEMDGVNADVEGTPEPYPPAWTDFFKLYL